MYNDNIESSRILIVFRNILYKYILVLFFSLLVNNNIFSERIEKIVINGNLEMSSTAIEGIVPVEIGDIVNNDTENLILKELYRRGIFEDINVSINNSILTINVKEGAFIKDIKLTDEKLFQPYEQMLQNKKGGYVTENKLFYDVALLRNGFNQVGQYDCYVEAEIQNNIDVKLPEIDLIMHTFRGKQFYIHDIKIIGNTVYSKGELLENIGSRTAFKFFPLILNRLNTNRDIYQSALSRHDKYMITNLYKQKGYLDCQVKDTIIKVNKWDGSVILTYFIDEGLPYILGDIKLENDINEIQEEIELLINDIPSGAIYNQKHIDDIFIKIYQIAKQHGYEELVVRNDINTIKSDNNIANLVIKVIKIKSSIVKDINISGNIKTQDRVIYDKLSFTVGEVYTEQKKQKSISNLMKTGYISAANMYLDNDGNVFLDVNDDLSKINIGVNGSIKLSNWKLYPSAELNFTDHNFNGTGERVQIRFSYSYDQGMTFGMANQYSNIFHTNMDFGFDLSIAVKNIFKTSVYDDYSVDVNFDELRDASIAYRYMVRNQHTYKNGINDCRNNSKDNFYLGMIDKSSCDRIVLNIQNKELLTDEYTMTPVHLIDNNTGKVIKFNTDEYRNRLSDSNRKLSFDKYYLKGEVQIHENDLRRLLRSSFHDTEEKFKDAISSDKKIYNFAEVIQKEGKEHGMILPSDKIDLNSMNDASIEQLKEKFRYSKDELGLDSLIDAPVKGINEKDEKYKEIKSTSLNLLLFMDYKITEQILHSIRVRFSYEDHLPLKAYLNPNTVEQFGVSKNIIIGNTFIYEDMEFSRNNILRDGYSIASSQDVSFIDDLYWKVVFTANYYKTILEDTIVNGALLNVKCNVGFMRSIFSDFTKIKNRFILGDITMKGFYKNGIGPRDNFNTGISYLGGENMYSGQISIFKPIASFLSKNDVVMKVFIELGNVWGGDIDPRGIMTHHDVIPNKFTDMRVSVGFGVITNLVFPLSIYLAFPLLKYKNDISACFHVETKYSI